MSENGKNIIINSTEKNVNTPVQSLEDVEESTFSSSPTCCTTKNTELLISKLLSAWSTHTKYLGVTIDERLTWNEHILAITNKARQVNGFLHWNFVKW